MPNIIVNGPLDPPPINDTPNASNLDNITDSDTVQDIEGHTVRVRVPMSDLKRD